MKERPILFSGQMVRAILDGHKTMTRRIVKPRHVDGDRCAARAPDCPYGVPGDRLWVKEAWKTCATYDPYSPVQIDTGAAVLWLADASKRINGPEEWGRYRHSRFMPRWASRITLEITGVGIQRLQEIGEEDAKVEGVDHHANGAWKHYTEPLAYCKTARDSFRSLWNTINAKAGRSWSDNPFVWVVEFKRTA